MKMNIYLTRRIQQLESSFASLSLFYMEKRLTALGKEEADLEDYMESRRKASAVLVGDVRPEKGLEFDLEASSTRARDDNPEHWKSPEDFLHELQCYDSQRP